jgi:hypothetical protein
MPADVSESYNSNHVTRSTSQFTSPDAPVEKVTVTTEEAEFPRPISPPAQIEDITIATSPPLPSLLKKMEQHDNDNPFRPQEPLYHEVDPIVEAYRNRPFPPSPVGSPIPHEHHHNENMRTHTTSSNNENGVHTTTTTSNHEYHHTSSHSYHNESSTPQKANTSTATHVTSASTPKRNSAGATGDQQQYPTISPDTQLLESNDLPPPKHAEIVTLEKKKRCGCCSVQ